MAVKYLKPGQDFEFNRDFGFSGSAQGRHDPRPHPNKNVEYGDGLARGGQPRGYQDGGDVAQQQRPRIPRTATQSRAAKPSVEMVPASLARRAAQGALKIGARAGAQAGARAAQAGLVPRTPPALQPTAPALPASGVPATNLPGAPPQGVAPMGNSPLTGQPLGARKGGFIKKAVKRPGRLKKLAARHGISLGQEIARDVHSPDKSLRSAAILGRRFRSGDLKK